MSDNNDTPPLASNPGIDSEGIFAVFLEPFRDLEPIRRRVHWVLNALPTDVIQDFVDDPCFRMALDDFVPGRGRKVWLASPEDNASRCVVLKHRLAVCSEDFAFYIIAHELAHAFLHNGGWGTISDPEHAADCLAADWGFPRPRNWM